MTALAGPSIGGGEEGSPVSLALTDLNGNLSVEAYVTKEVK